MPHTSSHRFRRAATLGLIGLAAISAAGLKPARAAGPPDYSVTLVPQLTSGGTNLGFGLNSLGQVVGQADYGPGTDSHALLYDGTTSTDLGTFAPGNAGQSFSFGINDKSQVAGYAANSSGDYHAFIANGASKTDLGTLGGSDSVAYGINASGTVVGNSTTAGGDVHAFTSTNGGALTDIGITGLTSRAYGINDAGTVVGEAQASAGAATSAFSYSGGTFTFLGAGDGSVANAINASGEIVGQNGAGDAFTYKNGSLTDIGTLVGFNQSIATAVNSDGLVVGEADLVTGGVVTNAHAFLYDGGMLYDLNSLASYAGFVFNDAEGINAQGEILVNGTNAFGQTQAFLLNPMAVPEPGSLTVLGLAGLFLFGLVLRRRRAQA